MRNHMRRLACFRTRSLVPVRPTFLVGWLCLAAIGPVLLDASGRLGAAPVPPDDSVRSTGQGTQDGLEGNNARPAGVGEATAVMDFESRPLKSLTANIGHKAGEEPADAAQGHLGRLQSDTSITMFTRNWPLKSYQWECAGSGLSPAVLRRVESGAIRLQTEASWGDSASHFGGAVLHYGCGVALQDVCRAGPQAGLHPRALSPGEQRPLPSSSSAVESVWCGAEAMVVTGLIFSIP